MDRVAQILIDLFYQIIFGLILELLLDNFPLVNCYENRPALVDGFTNKFKILNFESRKCIHHIHNNMALSDM